MGFYVDNAPALPRIAQQAIPPAAPEPSAFETILTGLGVSAGALATVVVVLYAARATYRQRHEIASQFDRVAVGIGVVALRLARRVGSAASRYRDRVEQRAGPQ